VKTHLNQIFFHFPEFQERIENKRKLKPLTEREGYMKEWDSADTVTMTVAVADGTSVTVADGTSELVGPTCF